MTLPSGAVKTELKVAAAGAEPQAPSDTAPQPPLPAPLEGQRAAQAASADLGSPEAAAAETPGTIAAALSPANIALWILAIIAFVAALYLGRAFVVPLLIGILVSYTLDPVVEWLKSCRIPRAMGAAIVLAIVVAGISWIGNSLTEEISAMSEKLPQAARKIREGLSEASERGAPSTLKNVQEAAKEIEGAAATVVGAKPSPRPVPVRPPEQSAWLRDYMLAQSATLVAFAAQTPIVLLLTYFLLASGSHFRRKLVQFVGPSLSRKKEVVRILEEIEVQVQRYLLAMLVTNVLIGVATWLAFEALDVEEAALWGVAAGVLHFIPYLGPAVIAFASGVAGFLQFGSLLDAVMVAGASLAIAGLIGMGFMTWLQGRFASVNSAVLFIALLFFGWLWGVWGLLLGAPLVAIAKVVCDRVDALKPAGELLGH
jgi:predicted PurR-regulated permease PerM